MDKVDAACWGGVAPRAANYGVPGCADGLAAKWSVKRRMKLFRYRKPSWKTVLGVTRARKQINRALGITALMRPFRAWGNLKRRVKRRVGYESDVGRLVRLGPPTPGGCLLPIGLLVAALLAGLLR